MKKKVVLLGSTGSVGCNACKVLGFHKDKFEVAALCANVNYKIMLNQAAALDVGKVVVGNKDFYLRCCAEAPSGTEVMCGTEAMIDCVSDPEVDIVVCAILGRDALLLVLRALECGKTVALASKEVMLMAGELVMATAKKYGGRIIPVDSEHSAIFQCMLGRSCEDVKSLILTCSGGPFRKYDKNMLEKVTLEDALKHPVWSMGRKITVDSASLMNKALEVIEAAYLFGMTEDRIKVLIHPEGIVHSFVEFNDNSVAGLFANPSMELPIQYALSYPDVLPGEVSELDLANIGALHFENVDNEVFPSIEIAREALRTGKNMPLCMNAANNVAVAGFCRGEIPFTGIWKVIEKTMAKTAVADLNDLSDILQADTMITEMAENMKVKGV